MVPPAGTEAPGVLAATTMEIVLTVAVVVAFTAILTLYSMKKRAEAWTGVVTKIDTVRRQRDPEQNIWEVFTRVFYKRDDGKKGKVKLPEHAVSHQFPDGINVGDRLVKTKGEYMPKREAKA